MLCQQRYALSGLGSVADNVAVGVQNAVANVPTLDAVVAVEDPVMTVSERVNGAQAYRVVLEQS